MTFDFLLGKSTKVVWSDTLMIKIYSFCQFICYSINNLDYIEDYFLMINDTMWIIE